MEILDPLKQLFELGGVVVVTVMLWIVWRRLNEVTDKLIDIQTEMRLNALAAEQREVQKRNTTHTQ